MRLSLEAEEENEKSIFNDFKNDKSVYFIHGVHNSFLLWNYVVK